MHSVLRISPFGSPLALQNGIAVLSNPRGQGFSPSLPGTMQKKSLNVSSDFFLNMAVREGCTRSCGPRPSGRLWRCKTALPFCRTLGVKGSHPPSRGICKKKSLNVSSDFFLNMAVREGFEPSIRCRIHTFQACSFSHSDTSPYCFYRHPQGATGRYYRESSGYGQADFFPFVISG